MSRIRANLITNQSADGSPTVQNGLVISGVTTSTSFSGSGASLTNIPSAQLTGALPAIDGSNLTGISAGTSLSGSTNNTVCTVTGANAIQGEANLTFDGDNLTVTGSNHVTQIFKAGGSTSDLAIDFKDSSNNLEAKIFCASDQGDLRFYTGGANERLRIASGGIVNIGGDYSQTSVSTQITGDLLVQKTASAYLNPNIDIYNYVDGGYAGSLTFSGNIGGSKYSQARIRAYGGSNTSDGSLAIETGNMSEKLRIKSDGVVLLPTTGKLSVGPTNPVARFQVGPANGSRQIEIEEYGVIRGYDRNSNAWAQIDFEASSYSFDCGGTERMKINSNGQVTKPSQPSFAAYTSSNSYTTSGNLVFNATRHNIGGHYSTSNGRFTAPIAGRYLFQFWSILQGTYTNAYYSIRINGSGGSGQYCHITKNTSNWDHVSNSWIFNLNANDYVNILSDSSINWHGNDWQLFSGQLLS